MNKEKKIKTTDGYDYFAFISYNSNDEAEAKKLHRTLERWRLPASLVKEKGLASKPMEKLFFAPSDIVPKELEEVLKENLRASEHLIVVCSPTSAKSYWVGFEIDYFCSLGRTENVHLIIVDGEPKSKNPDTECFHPNLKKHFNDLLSANIHEKHFKLPYLNRQRAYVQLIAAMLDVKFDAIWRRHRRRMIEKLFFWFCLLSAFALSLFAVWKMDKTTDISLSLSEQTVHNPHLPPLRDAKVCFTIGGNTIEKTINSFEDTLIFPQISLSSLEDTARLRVSCEGWLAIDTLLIPSEKMTIGLSRDAKTFGYSKLKLGTDKVGEYLSNYPILVEGVEFVSDENDTVEINLPLDKQKVCVHISCERNPQGFHYTLDRGKEGEINLDWKTSKEDCECQYEAVED